MINQKGAYLYYQIADKNVQFIRDGDDAYCLGKVISIDNESTQKLKQGYVRVNALLYNLDKTKKGIKEALIIKAPTMTTQITFLINQQFL